MKGYYKPPEKQLNDVDVGNIPQKVYENEYDSGFWEKYRGKDWEDTRNVYQRPTRTKEQTNRNK